ncbi:MAG: asparagine--tRNA ligase [candidate division Zixibacteria bacterium]|nr:asparagine--tRNA ligase [candidate division Zixibacteria bacterium]
MDYKNRVKISSILVDESVESGQTVALLGWVRTVRVGKEVGFVEINDGSCRGSLQGVIANPNESDVLHKLTTGCSVRMEGQLVESQGKGQKYEIQVKNLKIIGKSPDTFPLQKKRHSFEFLREIAHLRPRSNTFGALNRLRSKLAYGIHQYFQNKGFYYIHTPIITSSDAEGAGEMFRVTTLPMDNPPKDESGAIDWDKDFFAAEAFLTVSGQLEGEALATALGDIYTFGPTFRAENSNTSRHASEFWMIEPEMAWAELTDNMDLAEDFLKELFKFTLSECADEMVFFNQWIEKGLIDKLEGVINSTFERLPYTEAVKVLEKNASAFEFPVGYGQDLQSEHERYLTEEVFKKPVIVYDYPEEIKSFYMRVSDDGKTVGAMDVLAPGIGEIIGGSQREERLDVLLARMKKKGMDPNDEALQWFIDLRRYGSVPHSGFGLGFERTLMYVTGLSNIRDVIPFPRVPRWAKF